MKFELKVLPSIKCDGAEVRELKETKVIFISREEIVSKYEEDETEYYVTFRELIYMYHSLHGFFTQVSDTTMYEMYETVKNDEEIKGIELLAYELEEVSTSSDFFREHSFRVDMRYVK